MQERNSAKQWNSASSRLPTQMTHTYCKPSYNFKLNIKHVINSETAELVCIYSIFFTQEFLSFIPFYHTQENIFPLRVTIPGGFETSSCCEIPTFSGLSFKSVCDLSTGNVGPSFECDIIRV